MMHEDKPPIDPPAGAVIMVDPEIIVQVRALSRLKWGTKRIAAELNLARNTVKRYQRLSAEDDAVQQRPRARRLKDAAQKEAVRLLGHEAEGNAVVIQRLLAAQGTVASLRTVQRVVTAERATIRHREAATVRFETPPGAQMQIDFGEKHVSIGGRKTKIYIFVAVLGYSRRIFAKVFLSQRHDDWREGISSAFRHFGGVTQGLLVDNPKAMVIRHERGGIVTFMPSFTEFCKDWSVSARACAPYRARTKGKTESGVKYAKRNGLAGISFTTFAALESHFSTWMMLADSRIHGTTGERPTDRFTCTERAALRPLPSTRLAVRQRRLLRKVANDCLVDVDSIRYSVPHRYVGCRVEVAVYDDKVIIFCGAVELAEHRRGTEPRARIVIPSHYDGLLNRHAKAPDSPQALGETTASCALEGMGRSLADYEKVIEGQP
jgi:transposase